MQNVKTCVMERFSLYVDPGEENECWEWNGSTAKERPGQLPYGNFRIKHGGKWATERAHRVAFFLAAGYWPDYVMHDCDNARCVNPNHLLEGTHRANVEDAVQKKRLSISRHNRGGYRKQEWRAPISLDDARAIRARYAAGEKQAALAMEFGVTQGAVSSIVRGRTRKEAA